MRTGVGFQMGEQRDLFIFSLSNLHSAFDISSRRSRQYIYIYVREQRPLLPHRACSVLRGTPASLYAYYTPPRRARSLRGSGGTQYHFAVTTPTKPCRAERVRPAAARITLCLLRLRYSAALSAFAPRHPSSLCGYAYDTPPR